MDKIAYMIMAHRDENHLRKLVERLNYNADFYIYIDKKASIERFVNCLPVSEYPNVYWIEKRHIVCWGGWSQAEPIVSLLEHVLKRQYARICFITGADYPIVSGESLYQKLTCDNEEYICASRLCNKGNERYLDKVTRRWYYDLKIKNTFILRISRKCLNLVLGIFPKRNPELIINGKITPVYYGFAYWAITEPCASYLYHTIQTNVSVKKFFKYSYAPIEMMPHTIIFNSSFRNKCKEFHDFKQADCMVYAPLHYVRYGEHGTRVMDETDYENIIASGKIFFQKADSKISEKLIKKLDED